MKYMVYHIFFFIMYIIYIVFYILVYLSLTIVSFLWDFKIRTKYMRSIMNYNRFLGNDKHEEEWNNIDNPMNVFIKNKHE